MRNTWVNGCNSLLYWEKRSREKHYFPFGIVSNLCYEQSFLSHVRERSFKKQLKKRRLRLCCHLQRPSFRLCNSLEIRTEQRLWEEFWQKLKYMKDIPWLRNCQSICSENRCISMRNHQLEYENISFVSESHASSVGLSDVRLVNDEWKLFLPWPQWIYLPSVTCLSPKLVTLTCRLEW